MESSKSRCENCGSTNLTKENIQSYSMGKGMVGQAIFGAGGAAMGINGKNECLYTCHTCGHKSKKSMNLYDWSDILECISHPVTNAGKKAKLERKYCNIDWSGEDIGVHSIEEHLKTTEKTNSITTSGYVNSDGMVTITIKCIKYKFNKDKDNAVIVGYDNNIGGNLKIPKQIEFEGKTYKVTQIEKAAFWACQTIRSIEIACSVTTIGERAFRQCTNVNSIYIPASVEEIGKNAFDECGLIYWMSKNGLSKVEVYCENDNVGYDFHWLYFNLHINAEEMFKNNSGYTIVTINDIKYRLYRNRADILELTNKEINNICIPETLESNSKKYIVSEIKANAFLNCVALTFVKIPISIISIERGAFSGCKKLKIYCEVKSKPQGWVKGWKPLFRKVIWGYKDENSVLTKGEN